MEEGRAKNITVEPMEGGPPKVEPPPDTMPSALRIIDVWDHNFFEEMEKIKILVESYPYIAMDTEFPGIVEVPRSMTTDYEYQLVKINVDGLKLIQLGITLFDKDGNIPEGPCCWQFNFKYNVDTDKSLPQSINVLKEAGINFEKHKTNGIDHALFAYYFLCSGLILDDDKTWICFQGNQDFGYMYRVLANAPLPDSEDDFLSDTKTYFPNLFDIKYMKHEIEELRGGLQRTGDLLRLDRIGQQHQAGSDSWLTGLVYFKLFEVYLKDHDKQQYNNVLFGLGISENDEPYLDNYTSKTDQLEREAREFGERGNYEGEDYMHQMDQYQYNFYQEGYMPQEMTSNYMNPGGYPGGQMLHPTSHVGGNMNNGENLMTMAPNMHPGYGMSPNNLEEYEQQQYPIQYNQRMAGHVPNPNQMEHYSNAGYYHQ